MDGAFDAVVIDQTWIHACEKPSLAWDEAWRLLRPGGRLIHLGGSDHPADAARVPADLRVRAERIPPPPGAPAILVLTREAGGDARGTGDP